MSKWLRTIVACIALIPLVLLLLGFHRSPEGRWMVTGGFSRRREYSFSTLVWSVALIALFFFAIRFFSRFWYGK